MTTLKCNDCGVTFKVDGKDLVEVHDGMVYFCPACGSVNRTSITTPHLEINSFTCKWCESDDTRALILEDHAVVWCSCGMVFAVDGDNVDAIHDWNPGIREEVTK